MSSPYSYTHKKNKLKSKWSFGFSQGLQRVWSEWLPHLIHLECRKLCSSFTGKLYISRTLWICWRLESLTYWPVFVLPREEIITLQRIVTASLFCRSMQNRKINSCLEKWESQFPGARCWQTVWLMQEPPARAEWEGGGGWAGRSTSGRGNGSSCLKTRTVLSRKHSGTHFLETQLKITVLIFYVNG